MTSSDRYSGFIKSLGPGLLWAGAAIGVSHLVQSTRAGASYGFALVGIVLVANVLKYPFFEYGPRYAAATGESLLEGYKRLGNWAFVIYLILTFGMMFTIQAAVTVVTAGIASQLFGVELSPLIWSGILLVSCALLLIWGKYALLDKLVKIIIIVLSLSTIIAVIAAVNHGMAIQPGFVKPIVWDLAGISFMVVLIGWMPSAFDVAVWSSIWTIERSKQTGHKPLMKEALFDFNLGYFGTVIFALVFLTLGAMVMYGSGEQFSPRAGVFAGQLIALFTNTLGSWSYPIIIIAAFTTMFSTTLTCLDAFPRVLRRSTEIVFPTIQQDRSEWIYWVWMIVVIGGSLLLLSVLATSMRFMVDLATTLSFVTAPILAIINYRLVTSEHMPEGTTPPQWLKILSWVGMLFLIVFSIMFLWWKFFSG
ncbi:MAG: divalent metal cation transporter [Candidatus Marinimicrobia bacterium]|nr:divalent metal cation transporter [Candidatus Neomarinimicrobiota bacterium]